jgi:hypothetical protein
VALPALGSLFPTRVFGAETTAASSLPKRVAWIYVPNGANMEDWTPAATGSNYEMSMILQPLTEHREHLTVLTGLANPMGDALGDGGGGHARAAASFLTGVHPRKTAGADIKAGISVDQIAANAIGEKTRLPSLELSCDAGQRAGSCDSGYSCVYQFNMSWKSETQPMNPEVNPRAAFERLFGNGDAASTLEASARRSLYRSSVLDYVLDDAHRMEGNLDAADRRKLDEYLTAVRDLETRIQRAAQFPAPKLPDGTQEPDNFESFEQQMQLMYDVLALAFQTDSTRISTYVISHDGSNRPYPQIGIREGHHDLSHHRNQEEKKHKLAQINRYHITQFARFLGKLKSMKEGEGSVLDNCMILYGSGLSDGNAHSFTNLPVLLAGGGSASAGQHVKAEAKTPMTNLYRSMLDSIGVHTEKIGDSSGKLDRIIG